MSRYYSSYSMDISLLLLNVDISCKTCNGAYVQSNCLDEK